MLSSTDYQHLPCRALRLDPAADWAGAFMRSLQFPRYFSIMPAQRLLQVWGTI
ncbi:MAG: hypothetical protein ACOX3D_02890 [Syntrophomonadales bacterium]